MIQPQPLGARSPSLFFTSRLMLVLAAILLLSDGTLKPKRTMGYLVGVAGVIGRFQRGLPRNRFDEDTFSTSTACFLRTA